MLDFILSGLQYGLLGGVAAIVFTLACILLSPVIIVALGLVSTILNIGRGEKNG